MRSVTAASDAMPFVWCPGESGRVSGGSRRAFASFLLGSLCSQVSSNVFANTALEAELMASWSVALSGMAAACCSSLSPSLSITIA